MRDIKFRIWLKEWDTNEPIKGKMFYNCISDDPDFKVWLLGIMDNGGYDGDFLVGGQIEEPMQFTGLLDKNGKEIFEGDIVKCRYDGKEYTAVVEWDKCNPAFVLRKLNTGYSFETYEYDFIKAGGMSIEILGNIFQNPDLLENK